MVQRLSILHVAQPTEAGVPHVVIGLVRDQIQRGWKVTVACPPDSVARPGALELGGEYAPWPARRSPGPATRAETQRLAGIVRQVSPHVVHLHSAKAGLAGRLTLRGRRPTVFQPHAWSFQAARGLLRCASLAWERAAARWASAIVCVSEAEQRIGTAAGIDAPYVLARQGVDLLRYTAQDELARRAARTHLGLAHGVPLAVCVGRLHRQKGQDALLDAWPRVRADLGAAELTLVGDGPERGSLERRAIPGVRFAGESSEVRTWLAAADVVVLPSRWEGLSLLLLEALACARSVVVTDVQGMREVVGDEAGAVVALGDDRALAAAISARLRDGALADREGRAGRALVERRHDAAEQQEMIAMLYTDLLRGADVRRCRT